MISRVPLKASTLNLFNRVIHFDDASGLNVYIESVEMFNYYKSIPSGLIAARMTYLGEKYKELMVALEYKMNGSCNEKFFHVEVTTRTDRALDHIIDVTFSSVEKFELLDRYTTLQSLYTALDHQL